MATPNQTVVVQVSGISLFAIGFITPLTSGESITNQQIGFLPSLDGQRRISINLEITDANSNTHTVNVVVDYRDEILEGQQQQAPAPPGAQ